MGNPQKPVQRNNSRPNVVIYCLFYFCFIVFSLWFSKRSIFCLITLSIVLNILFSFGTRILRVVLELILWRKIYSTYTELILKALKMKHWQNFSVSLLISGVLAIAFKDEKERFEDILSGKQLYSLFDIMISFFIIIMAGYFRWDDSPLTFSYRLEECFSISGGSSMALGFFYGYLKLILPQLLDSINNFQNKNGISHSKIPEKKLFILIPSSTFIFNKLRITGKENIEQVEERLDPQIQDRGMVLGRVYKNTIYRIKCKYNNAVTKYYVPLEGATPLMTFHETCSHNPKFKEFKREVISSFYYTLEKLIFEDKNVNGLVELIYYNDEKQPDISYVVRERIKYLKKFR